MRVTYVPTQSTQELFRSALNNDLGVFRVQQGAGIGGFLRKIIKYVIPVGKSILRKGFDIAKPHLQEAAGQLLDSGVHQMNKQITSVVNQAHQRVGSKRKFGTLE